MKYIKAIWHLQPDEYKTEPIEFFYEVEDKKLLRGFELFIDRSYQVLPQGLDIPSLEVMNDLGGEFTAFEIKESEFLYHWNQFEDEIRQRLQNTLETMILSIKSYRAEELSLKELAEKLQTDFSVIYNLVPVDFYKCWNPNWGNLGIILAEISQNESVIDEKRGEIENDIEKIYQCLSQFITDTT